MIAAFQVKARVRPGPFLFSGVSGPGAFDEGGGLHARHLPEEAGPGLEVALRGVRDDAVEAEDHALQQGHVADLERLARFLAARR